MEYWREGSISTAISPTSTSDFVGQHTKVGGINFGATLVQHYNQRLRMSRAIPLLPTICFMVSTGTFYLPQGVVYSAVETGS